MILNSNDNENHFHLKAFSDFEESENRLVHYNICNNFSKYSCNIYFFSAYNVMEQFFKFENQSI